MNENYKNKIQEMLNSGEYEVKEVHYKTYKNGGFLALPDSYNFETKKIKVLSKIENNNNNYNNYNNYNTQNNSYKPNRSNKNYNKGYTTNKQYNNYNTQNNQNNSYQEQYTPKEKNKNYILILDDEQLNELQEFLHNKFNLTSEQIIKLGRRD